MSSIVELVTFSVGQGKDFDGLRSTLESVGNANGSLKVFHGIQIEDKTVGYLALVWNSEEALANWTGRDSFEAKSREIIGEPSGPRLKLHVSEVSSSVSGAFEAPVTEFAFAKLKSEANREEYNATSTVLGKQVAGTEKGSGYSPAFGPATGGETVDVAIIIGWDSPEAHMNAVKDLAGVGKLAELSQLSVVHSNFTKLL